MNHLAVDSELVLKATPSRAPKSFLVRERLALSRPRFETSNLIMIQAPAGYGKSSILAQWRREALARGAICAWLTLDERDTAARLVPGRASASRPCLPAGPRPPP